MCEDVMALSNNLIYNGRLKCGNLEVASRSIHIPNINGLQAHHVTSITVPRTQKNFCLGANPGKCWIRDLIDQKVKVRFVNTDPLLPMSREEAKGNRIVNQTEAQICKQLVNSLLSVGVPADSIGVMTHYRSQLGLLKHSLRSHPDVEMHTTDRFQGRDKEVIILSLVRSNETRSIGELLKDWRRINVAFTRAKTKLLVIGSRETLKGIESTAGNQNPNEPEMVAKFIALMEEKGWIYDMPPDSLNSHDFEEAAPQATADVNFPPTSSDWKPIHSNNKHDVDEKENLGGHGHMNLAGGLERQLPVQVAPKERREPKRVRVGARAVFHGKPIMRDVMNELGLGPETGGNGD
jgi:DNA replication ATP-dependent helicase Dna2